MNDFIFSERLVLIYCLKFAKKYLEMIEYDDIPDYVTPETIQDLIDELGGNPELNTKRYREEQIRKITKELYDEINDEMIARSELGKQDELSGVI